jgi:hypothetical protein
MPKRKTAIERLPAGTREYIERSLCQGVSTTEIRSRLAAEGHGNITARQLQHHSQQLDLSALERPMAVLRANYAGKISLSSDDALLSVLGDALEQLDRLGRLARSVPNSRLERILADTYPSVFAMLKEVVYDAGQIERVRALENRGEEA